MKVDLNGWKYFFEIEKVGSNNVEAKYLLLYLCILLHTSKYKKIFEYVDLLSLNLSMAHQILFQQKDEGCSF